MHAPTQHPALTNSTTAPNMQTFKPGTASGLLHTLAQLSVAANNFSAAAAELLSGAQYPAANTSSKA